MRLVDPPVREDGRCALESCGKPRKLTKVARKYAGEQLDLDPFCSAVCCRAFYGVVFAGFDVDLDEETSEARAKAPRERNRRRKLEAGIST